MNNLIETLRQSPATTDSKQNASEYNDMIRMIFSNIAQKSFLMRGLKSKFTVEDYFILKNTFALPDFTVNAYAKNSSNKPFVTYTLSASSACPNIVFSSTYSIDA